MRSSRLPWRTTTKHLSKKNGRRENQDDDFSDSEFVFETETTSKASLPAVRINGIKGQVEADSCSTVNITDEKHFELLRWRNSYARKLYPDSRDVMEESCRDFPWRSHGIVKTKQLLRSKVRFLGIDKCIENLIVDCLPCQAFTSRATQDSLPCTPENSIQVQVSANLWGPFPTWELVLVVLFALSGNRDREEYLCRNYIVLVFEHIFSIHGYMRRFRTRRGPFIGKLLHFARSK